MTSFSGNLSVAEETKLEEMSTEDMIEYIPSMSQDTLGRYHDHDHDHDENHNSLSESLLQYTSKYLEKSDDGDSFNDNVSFCRLRYYNPKAFHKLDYDDQGYNFLGEKLPRYSILGYDSRGYDQEGYNIYGVNKHGFTRQDYGSDGYNRLGFDKDGYDKDGKNIIGLTREDYE